VNLRRSASALVAVLLLAASPSPARAGFWAAISGGAWIATGTSIYGSLESRPTASLAVGYDWEYVGTSLWAGLLSTGAGVLLTENAFPVVARVRGRLPLGIVVPYAFGGVGVAPTRANVNLVASYATAFTAQAGAGVDFELADMFTIGVEGGYQWLRPNYSFGTLDLNGVLALATFALRFP
jgi:hypothetical protein